MTAENLTEAAIKASVEVIYADEGLTREYDSLFMEAAILEAEDQFAVDLEDVDRGESLTAEVLAQIIFERVNQ